MFDGRGERCIFGGSLQAPCLRRTSVNLVTIRAFSVIIIRRRRCIHIEAGNGRKAPAGLRDGVI